MFGLYRKINGKKYELYDRTNLISDVRMIKEYIYDRYPRASVRIVKNPNHKIDKNITDYKYGIYVHKG